MGSLTIYGNASHTREVFPHVETSHIWQVFLYLPRLPVQREVFPCMGRLPKCRKFSHTILEVSKCTGSLPMCGKSCHTWEVVPYMGMLPMYVMKTSHSWVGFP
jgi:hypothetical protein